MTYNSNTIIANITKATSEHHNNDTNHHMIIMMHKQIGILGEYWIQDMKNEKYCEW
jgi:hemerythrin superfamily protein